jgi:hypothetical protein
MIRDMRCIVLKLETCACEQLNRIYELANEEYE